MKNLVQKATTTSQIKLLEIIGRQMEKTEDKSSPWIRREAASNTLLLYSFITETRKTTKDNRAEISRGWHYDTQYISEMGIIPFKHQKTFEYDSKNTTHEKRLIELLL